MKKVFLLAGLFGLFTVCASAQSSTPVKTNSNSVAKNTTRPRQTSTTSTIKVPSRPSTEKSKIVATHKKYKKKMHKKVPAKK